MQQPFQAALAAGRAHQRRTSLRVSLAVAFPLILTMTGWWIWTTCFEHPIGLLCGVFVTIALVALPAVPLIAIRLPAALALAERSNRESYLAAVQEHDDED
jgi:hypothetical protein